jgi:hypothetical protein
METEEPTIVSAPGFVGKSVFANGKAVDPEVRRDERFITEEYGPMVLSPGETLDVLDSKEKGELIYIKVVTDNPYANVYLELDDFRNNTNGETHAELLYEQRTSAAEGQFYVTTDGTNGKGFPMVWNPQTNPTNYSQRIRLRVTNPLRRNDKIYGVDLNFTGRGGEPTPIQPLHMGGGSFSHSSLAGASLDILSKAMANPVGATVGYTVDSVINEAVFNNDSIKLGEGNLYAGLSGKPLFRRDRSCLQSGTTPRGTQMVNGVQALAAEVAATADCLTYAVEVTAATGFPGSDTEASTSLATITLSTTGGHGNTNAALKEFTVGDKVFIRNGDTVHLLGECTAITHSDNLVKVTTKPGIKNALSSFSGNTSSETTCFGTVEAQGSISPDMLVRKVIIKRKRMISYEG